MLTNTIHRSFTLFVIFGTVALLSSACVGKKKFLREVSIRDSTNLSLNNRILSLNQEIGQLKLQLAEKTGENKALTDLQDKQNNQISRLQDEIEKITKQSLSQQQMMDVALKTKAEEVAQKEQFINSLGETHEQQQKKLEMIAQKVEGALQPMGLDDVSILQGERKLSVGLSEKLLFKSAGRTSLDAKGTKALAAIAAELANYPEFSLMVTGHTDTSPVKNKAYTDNLDLSAVQAAAVARALGRDFGLNPSQITVTGKGEYEPRASNESAETRELNRRVEIILLPQYDRVLDQLQDSAKRS
jgi:chemotaxis protein MotB